MIARERERQRDCTAGGMNVVVAAVGSNTTAEVVATQKWAYTKYKYVRKGCKSNDQKEKKSISNPLSFKW